MNPSTSLLRLLPLVLLLLAPVLASAQSRSAPVIRELDRVVAVVNKDVITANELAQRVAAASRQLRRQGVELPPADVLSKQVLERLIVDRALVHEAAARGVSVDERQIDSAFARLAQQNRLSAAQLSAQLGRDGISVVQFREDLRNEILITRLREREVDARMQITEADIDAFLAEQGSSTDRPPLFNIAQILLRIPEGASSDQIDRQRARGEEVLKQLAAGADFAKMAAAYSDAPDAMTGGVLGARPADRLPQLFVQAVSSLQPGQIARLVRSPNGFHVLKLIDRQKQEGAKALGAPVVQTRVRHILIRPSELVSEPAVLRRLAEIRDRVSAGQADFADLARQYSNDGSAGRGGDLGWIYLGDTVPDFERAMMALEPGQISQPVRTDFGYHLIQVLERRTDAASPDRIRAAARQSIRERRIEEETQDWIRQVRDRAYVEYRD
jgi:peptidyl-prolyl cis-trans isomerase SurA